ncbi:MAG: SAM-dependent methyltransferase [Firmicutes bacterium]|nr:SAM-dependent methyltransferase [Bacillota bacterium]
MTHMDLSPRLEAILSCFEKGTCLADVGTDHAYLPIEAVRRGLFSGALALDVRKGPLERAEAHIRQACLQDRVFTRLSDGFEALNRGEADAALIAGMGGPLMLRILTEGVADGKLSGLSQLVLEPQSELNLVRRTIHTLANEEGRWQIRKEKLVKDRDKFYFILILGFGADSTSFADESPCMKEDWSYSPFLIRARDMLYLEYLKKKTIEKQNLLDSLLQKPSVEEQALAARIEALKTELTHLQEVMALWESPSGIF